MMENRMEAYTGFARVYDNFMDDVPYGEWCDYICDILKEYGIGDGLVLDLGCGTGQMTRLLKQRGYDMIGVDLSEEMLEIAREYELEADFPDTARQPHKADSLDTACRPRKAACEKACPDAARNVSAGNGQETQKTVHPILYLQQDMREFELYGTVRAIVCLCDSLNYILEPEELCRVFALANNYLDPGGIFIFDLNTVYKYREMLGDSVFCENRAAECFTWENCFDEESGINEYALNFFVRQENGLYERFEEFHYQRAYERGEVEKLLEKAGLQLLAVYGEGTCTEPAADCGRMYFVAREQGKLPKDASNGCEI